MKVIHVGWYGTRPTGGVVRTILEQTRMLAAMGVPVEIWQFNVEVSQPVKMETCETFDVWHLPQNQKTLTSSFSLPPATRSWVASRLGEIGLFHIHSVFIPENFILSRMGKPYILTPNGGWSEEVMNGKRKWKKLLWVLAREAPMWRKAALVQAVSREELRQLGRFRGIARTEYIPNGTKLPEEISSPEERDCYLFMGRLDIHQKGLDRLLEAMKILRQSGAVIPRLVIAGPDYRGGEKFIRDYIAENGLGDMIELRGPVLDQEKDSLFKRARLFVHTSRWEGLPLVLLEALSYAIPCLLTPGTNVAGEWAEKNCATRVSDDPADIAAALATLATTDLAAQGIAARRLAETEFSWEQIARKLSAAYQDVLSK